MTALLKPIPPRMTVAEFLAWPGDGSRNKFQLVDGEPRAMAPASPTHGTIQGNLAVLIGTYLRARLGHCRLVIEPGVVPRVRASTNMRIPDIGVTCTPDDPSHRSLPDPVLLIEIMSRSNETETWEAVWSYTTIPSVSEILVVHSTEVELRLLRRQADASWPEDPASLGAGDSLQLESVGLEVAVSEIYAGTYLA